MAKEARAGGVFAGIIAGLAAAWLETSLRRAWGPDQTLAMLGLIVVLRGLLAFSMTALSVYMLWEITAASWRALLVLVVVLAGATGALVVYTRLAHVRVFPVLAALFVALVIISPVQWAYRAREKRREAIRRWEDGRKNDGERVVEFTTKDTKDTKKDEGKANQEDA